MTTLTKRMLTKKAIFCDSDEAIDRVIGKMIKFGISSVLIVNDAERVVGIVTERDILRKIATLDIDRKLDHPIRTVMSVDVAFVSASNLLLDIVKLHSERGLRHFPVQTQGNSKHKDNILGIITVTDLARQFLDDMGRYSVKTAKKIS
jgi:CBS domain-containing protein